MEISGVGRKLAHSVITLRNYQGNLDKDLLEVMLRGKLNPSQLDLLDFSPNSALHSVHLPTDPLPTPPTTYITSRVHSAPAAPMLSTQGPSHLVPQSAPVANRWVM